MENNSVEKNRKILFLLFHCSRGVCGMRDGGVEMWEGWVEWKVGRVSARWTKDATLSTLKHSEFGVRYIM